MEAGKVFTELKRQILDMTLRPGTELNLNSLATLFGVSRSPVRDAVKELATQNLVDIFPQRGTYVSRINLSWADDERFIRLTTEMGALEKFMLRKTEDDVDAMKNLIDRQERAFALRDTSSLLSLDDQFHRIIYRVAGKERVFDFILTQNGNYHRMRVISFMFDNIAAGAIEQHRELVKVIESGDFDALRDMDRKHISKLILETDSFRASMPQYFVE